MEIIKEQIDELNAVLKIQLKEEDYTPKVDTSLTDLKKKVSLKGFRPGKVPMGLVKKMYGKSVLYDEVNKMISESLTKYMSDEKLQVIGEPIPNEKQELIDFDTQKEFEFIFDIGLRPEFEISLSKKLKIPYYEIKADGKIIDQYIDSYTGRYGKLESIDKVIETAVTKGYIDQLDSEGNILENGIGTDGTSILIEKISDKSEKKKFIDAKVDDVIKIDINKTFSTENEIASVLGIEKDKISELDNNFQYTIKEITNFIKAEINEDLFKKVYPKDEIKTEDEFKNKIREEIKAITIKDSDYKFAIDSREKIIEKTDIALPEDFLKRWLLLKDENKELTGDKFEEDFSKFLVDLKWQLITSQIAEKNEIKVDYEEVKELAVDLTKMQLQQYGAQPDMFPQEQLEHFANEMYLKKEDEVRKLYDKKFEDKVVNLIKESVKLDNKEVSPDEFNELFTKK
ncbi:MAG: trigger factor [Bacteroidales bacterium]|nr:trigger factor [Bacteroidales bacterium]MBN2758391.1 trigger factor [Bacteroidales bacterium]